MSSKNLKTKSINSIPSELPSELKEILKKIPEKDRTKVLKEYFCVESVSYQGILPHPEHLAKLNEIIPNGADRILILTENQSNHRINIESKVISSQIRQSATGQWMAFALVIMAFGLTYLLAISGHDVVAGTIAGTTIVGLAATFLYGKLGQKKELKEKAK